MKLNSLVAERINDLFNEKNTNQRAIARKIGIHHNTINYIVKGKNKTIKLNTIALICRGLDMTLDEFFNDPIFKTEFEVD